MRAILLSLLLSSAAWGQTALPVPVPPPPPVPVVQAGPVAVVGSNQTLIINSVFGLLTLIINGALVYLMAGVKARADIAEDDRKVIKSTLAETTAEAALHHAEEVKKQDQTLQVVNDVHVLVNSNMRVALQANATLARRIADLTKTPADAKAADDADKAVLDHDKGQQKLDATKAAEAAAPARRAGDSQPVV